MRWDRKMAVMTAVLLAVLVLLLGVLVLATRSRISDAGERMAEHADVGYAELMERIADLENVGLPMIGERGRYRSQSDFADFDEAWLQAATMVGGSFRVEDIQYDYTVTLRLRTYDTENIYEEDDTRQIYGRYTDTLMLCCRGDLCYAIYQSGKKEYRFILECTPLTDWLETVG